MAKERSSAKVVGWLGGIAATVISGYLLWYFEQPKPTPPQPPQAAVTTFEGMVYSGEAPVAKALVALDLTGNAGANGAIHDLTDDNGAYKIELTGLPPGTGATLSVVAKGFEKAAPKMLVSPLQADMRVDIPLSPVVLAAAPGSGGGGGGGPAEVAPPPETHSGESAGQPVAVGPPVTAAISHVPLYRPKSAAMAMKFRVAAK
ncbi:MAG TPA: hypothetical protein VGR47_14690 [Terracidiphilus sp.]|nr:hypothetical protein [Terracidiphilus sp.]